MATLSGQMLLPSDMADALQGDATVHDPASGALVTQIASGDPAAGVVPFGSSGDLLASGIWGIAAESTSPANIGTGAVTSFALYDADVQLLANVTSVIPGGGDSFGFVRKLNSTAFCVAIDGPVTNVIYLVSDAGVVSGTTYTLPVPLYSLWGITVDPTGQILYYVADGGTQFVIKRWDLVNDIAMSDLATGPSNSRVGFDALITAPDGSIVIQYATTGVTPRPFNIANYDPSGTLMNQLALGTSSFTGYPELGVDPSDTEGVWVKSFNVGLTTTTVRRLRASDFAVLNAWSGQTLSGGGVIPVSCPVLVFPGSTPPPCPGLVTDPRTDGLPYTPPVVPPCAGTGQRGSPRPGLRRLLRPAA